MRNLIYNVVIFISLLSLLSSCYPMDDNYAWLIKDGPIVYLNKADTAVALGGRNKIRLKWFKNWDSRAVTAKAFWNGNKDSVSIDLSKNPTEYVIASLPETVYSFELFFYSANGLKSCATSVVGRAYGNTYESLLLNRIVKISPDVENPEYIQFLLPAFSSDGYIESEIKYTDKLGNDQFIRTNIIESDTIRVLKDQISFDHDLSYRSIYNPSAEGFDELFYSKWSNLNLPS